MFICGQFTRDTFATATTMPASSTSSKAIYECHVALRRTRLTGDPPPTLVSPYWPPLTPQCFSDSFRGTQDLSMHRAFLARGNPLRLVARYADWRSRGVTFRVEQSIGAESHGIIPRCALCVKTLIRASGTTTMPDFAPTTPRSTPVAPVSSSRWELS